MSEYRLSELLDMSIIQKLADSNFSASGFPMTITDAIDGSFLVKAGWPGICTYFHRVNPDSHDQCRISDRVVKDHLDKEAHQYRCNNGLWHIALPIVVAGSHLGTVFLTQFWFDDDVVDREYFVNQAATFGFELDGYLAALDRLPVFSRDKVEYIVAYDKALVRFIADLAEQSLRVIDSQEALQKAHDQLDLRVRERTADLAEANQLLVLEIAERKRFEEKLREISEVDHLTMIFNRRKLFEFMGFELEKARRYARPLSLIMLDLDHFKKVNDRYGHTIGDSVLRETAHVVNGLLRKTDVFARYGGEEFIVLCTETDIAGAAALAEKIRLAVEEFAFPVAGTVTVSAGVAEYLDEINEAAFIEKADAALYTAKKRGRNRVVAAGTQPDKQKNNHLPVIPSQSWCASE